MFRARRIWQPVGTDDGCRRKSFRRQLVDRLGSADAALGRSGRPAGRLGPPGNRSGRRRPGSGR